ncbi:MAG: DNA (cytosine-5-)-methyltransferase [Acidobacteria bacterium]|nr:DNA (cytosine-5-)-methyltransferase [Acidobacteriota bacterium]
MTNPQTETHEAPEKPKAASFFSGIGGLDKGFQDAGFEISFQCEIDDFCTEILQKHWPDVKRERNIKGLDVTTIPVSQIWLGGFPCQDVSLARMGPRAGLKGARSGLFHDFAGLLDAGRPQVFVLENVPGLLSSHKGRDFGTVIRTLADIGYSLGWRVLNSKNFGVPQSRSRVYIVGCYRDRRGPAEILFEPECGEGDAEQGEPNGKAAVSPFKEILGDTVKGPVFQKIAYCLYACSARHTGTDWSRTYVTYPDGRVRRLMPRECEGVMGFPVGWTRPVAASYTTDDPDDIDTMRYQALGNAVTPPVAKWLAGRIKRYLEMAGAENAQETKPSRPTYQATEDAAIAARPAAAAPPV